MCTVVRPGLAPVLTRLAITQPPDLTSCDREPIHSPGSIQPHGVMLIVDREALRVRHAAGDVEGRLEIDIWEGEELKSLIGAPLSARIASLRESGTAIGGVGQFRARSGEVLDVSAHHCGSYLIVELEAASSEALPASLLLDDLARAASGFERAPTLTALCKRAVAEFRELTGYDRVMVYRFRDDDAGEVLAEAKAPDIASLLNHRFPASDIPRQARALYLRNTIRVIPDASYEPVPLRPSWTGPPLDMSASSLRSVSPIHLRYLANMGVRASASISIVKDGSLWGLIACHHRMPGAITYDVRAACRSLVGSLARQIKGREEAEGYRQRIRLRNLEDELMDELSREDGLDQALSGHLGRLERLIDSDGVAVLRDGMLSVSGRCPPEDDIRALAAWIPALPGETAFATEHLSGLYPPGLDFTATGSGLLAVKMASKPAWLVLWFRAEQLETVEWAGNPHKSKERSAEDVLTPRASFDAWRETVSGRSRRWSLPEEEAATRFRADILELQRDRNTREMNRQLLKVVQDKDVLLQQKEFLITEVNHRVQNSLQIVSSFLSLQARSSGDPELSAALEEARRRLRAVALVHRRLYRGDQLQVVDASKYIEELCADIFAFMGEDWAPHLSLDLSPAMLSTDVAVTLGLVLTELLINVNKYAYGGSPGPIDIVLVEDRARLRMIIADKGVGRASAQTGFGSRIVEALVSQLEGELSYENNEPGLRAVLVIPVRSDQP
jgi:chemotaxis family two-component system sensor kinase Cph1